MRAAWTAPRRPRAVTAGPLHRGTRATRRDNYASPRASPAVTACEPRAAVHAARIRDRPTSWSVAASMLAAFGAGAGGGELDDELAAAAQAEARGVEGARAAAWAGGARAATVGTEGRQARLDRGGERVEVGREREAEALLEPGEIAPLELVSRVEAIQVDEHRARREHVRGEAHRVERAEAGVRHEQHEVGRERARQLDAVAVARERRARAARQLHEAEIERGPRPRSCELVHQVS